LTAGIFTIRKNFWSLGLPITALEGNPLNPDRIKQT